MFLTTYINEVDGRSGDGEVCEVLPDGFLVHLPIQSAAPLDGVSIPWTSTVAVRAPAPYQADLRVQS